MMKEETVGTPPPPPPSPQGLADCRADSKVEGKVCSLLHIPTAAFGLEKIFSDHCAQPFSNSAASAANPSPSAQSPGRTVGDKGNFRLQKTISARLFFNFSIKVLPIFDIP